MFKQKWLKKGFRFSCETMLVTLLILSGFATSAQAQLQVAADIHLNAGDGKLTETKTLVANPGNKIVIEVFATGFTNSLGVEAIFQLDDPSAVSKAEGSSQGGPYSFPLTSAIKENKVNLTVGSLGAPVSINVPTPQLVGSLTLTLAQGVSKLNITLISIAIGANTPIPQNILFTVSDASSIPIVNLVGADLNGNPGNQNVTNSRVNPGLGFPLQIFAGGMTNITAFEIHVSVLNPESWIMNGARFSAQAPFEATATGGGGLPSPVASSSPRAAIDIAPGLRGDETYNPQNLSVQAGIGGTVAVELYGAGYRDVSGLTAIFELANPTAVQRVTLNPAGPFPLKLRDPIIEGNRVTANLGVLRTISAPGSGLQLLGTFVFTLGTDVSKGVGITLKSLAFQVADKADDLITPNAVVNATGSGGILQGSTVQVDGNTFIAKATSKTPVSGNVMLGQFNLFTSQIFRSGQIIINQVIFTAGERTQTLSPNLVLTLGSFISDAPVVTNPPVPVTITDTRAIIQWETNKPSKGQVLFGRDPEQLDRTAEGNSTEWVALHRVRLNDLLPNTRYFFKVVNTDEKNNTSEPFPTLPHVFTTRALPDNQPPQVLKGPSILGLTNNRAQVVLFTDEAAVVQVNYGTSATELTQEISRANSQLEHNLVLENLTPGTEYFFRVRLTDLNGNTVTTPTRNFRTQSGADTFPPRILSRSSVLGNSYSATVIAWLTDEASNSTVFYGKESEELTDSIVVQETVRDHKLTLSNLLAGVRYIYRVRSVDANGNTALSELFNFTTRVDTDTFPPQFVKPPVIPHQGDTDVLIVFETNEPTTATVQYDTTVAVYEEATGTVGQTAYASTPNRRHEITLTNLSKAKRYYYKIGITDLAQNGPITNPGRLNFATRALSDTNPPVVFSRPVAVGITNNSAIITWGADEPHNAIIRFGTITAGTPTTTTNLTSSLEEIEFKRTHATTISDLTAGTTYAYEVETIDGSGNTSTSKNLQFTTQAIADNKPPVIVRGPVVRNFTESSVTIDWATDEPSDSRVSYGLDTSYGTTVEDATGTRAHSVTLTELQPGTEYHYAVGSADQTGNVVTTDASGTIIGLSKNHTFITLLAADAQPPVITEGPIVEFTNQIAGVRWTTDELSTSRVVIGVVPGSSNIKEGTPVFGEASQYVVENNDLVTSHSVTITGLESSIAYLFQAFSTDASGNTGGTNTPTPGGKFQPPGGFGSFTTASTADTQFPVITKNPTVIAATSSSLTIEWKTDESANSVVNFGTSSDSLTLQEVDGINVNQHQMVLTKLTAGKTYAFKVASTDASGNGATQSAILFGTTLSSVDLTAPVISKKQNIIYKNDRSATIQWTTNEAADSKVTYGTRRDSLTVVRSLPDLATDHTVTLTNLSANTLHYYQVASSDANNNGPTQSQVDSFRTETIPDNTAPSINASSVKVVVADSTATITWTTNEISDSAVLFATAVAGKQVLSSSGDKEGDATDVIEHSITLTNLNPNTNYVFQVESIDASNNGPTQSSQLSFSTVGTGDVQPPAAPTGLVVSAGNGAVKLFWSASPTDGVTGYVVERATSSGDFAPVTTLENVTNYLDNNVTNGTAYRYRVSAIGLKQLASTPSSPSNDVTPTSSSGPSTPALFTLQGNPLAPTLVVKNSTPINAADLLNYTFHIATSSNFSDAIALEAGVSPGSGLGSGDPSGITAWTVNKTLTDGTTYYYRVKSSDGAFDSNFLTGSFKVNANAPAYPGDFSNDLKVNFTDFLTFISTFNKKFDQTGYVAIADFDGDSSVGFSDFLSFITYFNKVYIKGTTGGSGKPVVEVVYGIDENAQFRLVGRPVQAGLETTELTVDITLSNAQAIKGYGVRITYDPATVQFISATDKGETLLNANGRTAELFGTLDNNPEKGEVFIASAVTQGDPVSGEGVLASLKFRLLSGDPSRVFLEIAQGLIIDGKLHPNAAQHLGGRFSLLPTDYALDHNFPNPFNPETTIRYALPEAGNVTLIIYNILGQEVMRLIDAEQMPGFYAVQWNGKDTLGRTVASGVYLYRLQAERFSKTHKMLLLK